MITVLVTQDTALLCLVMDVVKKDAVIKLDVVMADILKLSINKTSLLKVVFKLQNFCDITL